MLIKNGSQKSEQYKIVGLTNVSTIIVVYSRKLAPILFLHWTNGLSALDLKSLIPVDVIRIHSVAQNVVDFHIASNMPSSLIENHTFSIITIYFRRLFLMSKSQTCS